METLLKEEILPGIVADCTAFGKNVKFVSFKKDKDHEAKEHFQSTAIFGTVVTSDGENHSVLIKMKFRNKEENELKRCDSQFHNEIYSYERVIPFLLERSDSDGPQLPRYIYGRNECGESMESDLIVLENVSPLGYRLSEELQFLDYDHLAMAMQAIAKFHGLSYTSKHKDPVGFYRAIADIQNVEFSANGKWFMEETNALYKFGKRGVDRLLARDGGHLYRDNKHLQRFIEIIKDGDNSIGRVLRPREPLSIQCHGDFNRNNLMFKYDEDGRRPVDVLLFDFGRSKYGSPALDLSLLLYMNTNQWMRETRWDDLLDVYCSELHAAVPSGVRVPNRTELHAEMTASALYGFSHSSFFIPFMVSGFLNKEDEIPFNEIGGDIATEYVADMVKHFVDMGYTNI